MELSLTNLTKNYDSFTAVNEVNINMKEGLYGLLGVNGAGKTTLMRMICTLIKPTRGSIVLDGNDIFKMGDEYRRKLGYLPQDFGYYPDLSVWDYLMYISSIKGLRPAAAKNRSKMLLAQVGMDKHIKTKMRKLSGGMLRRVGIVQAMLNNPEILILDEPTAGLDPNERIRFRNLISELADNRLVLLSTHIVSDIEFIANEIILMNEGKIFFTGNSDQLISSVPLKVWTCIIQKQELNEYLRLYSVANIRTISQGVELRILSEEAPVINAEQVQATLEDAFLFYFGEKAVSINDPEV